MWAAGILASISSISYPAISAFVSMHSDADRQGVVQGMVTGMRGLCNGLGPAMFGLIFYLFHVDLNEQHTKDINITTLQQIEQHTYVQVCIYIFIVLGKHFLKPDYYTLWRCFLMLGNSFR